MHASLHITYFLVIEVMVLPNCNLTTVLPFYHVTGPLTGIEPSLLL